MHANTPDIAALLLRCEQDGLASRYDDTPDSQVAVTSHGAESFVVSDLHLTDSHFQSLAYSHLWNNFQRSFTCISPLT